MAEELKNVKPVNPQEDVETVEETVEVKTDDVEEVTEQVEEVVEETKEAEETVEEVVEDATEAVEETVEEVVEATEEVVEEAVEEVKPEEPAAEANKKPAGDIYDQIRVIERDELATETKEELNPELEKMYERTLNKFSNNERVNGHVIRITDKEVVVDIGFKSEGLIPVEEFGNNIPELGDEIEIYVDKIEDRKGQLILSKKKADFLRAWERLKEVHEYWRGKTVGDRVAPVLTQAEKVAMRAGVYTSSPKTGHMTPGFEKALEVGFDGIRAKVLNQIENLTVNSGSPTHISNFNVDLLKGRQIEVRDHCFACTTGAGSSCCGALMD